MAKKKLSHLQSHDHNLDDAPTSHPHSHPSNVDDGLSDKFQNLKNLNSLLIKETSEHRKHVESLLHDKETLESAFNRSAMEKRDLEFQLSEATDGNVGLDLQNSLVFFYVETQVREMGFRFDRLVVEKSNIERAKAERESEIALLKDELSQLTVRLENERDRLSRLSRERDEMKKDFDELVSEANLLKDKVIEAEKKENVFVNEIENLRMDGVKLREQKDEKEGAIRELTTERDLALRKSAEAARVIEELKEEITVITRYKCESEEQKNAQALKIVGLELELKRLNESLESSSKEEALLRSNIGEYEKGLAQALENEKDMEVEIGALLKEKKENEESIKMLTERRDNVQKILDMVQKELEDRQSSLDEAIRVKNEIEEEKVSRENEIVELQREVDQLKDAKQKLEESCTNLKEKNKQLLSEVDHNRSAAEEALLERDNVKKEFNEEKNKVKKLTLEVTGLEVQIEQSAKELGEIKSEREELIERNKMVERRVEILVEEKDMLHKRLVETKQDCDGLKAKVEFSNQALVLLKNTAALVCQSKHEASGEEVVSVEKEMMPYAEELDAIKSAFNSKNKMVEEMKQQLASLEDTAAEAQKGKSLWTAISSATTIVAAALAAYVARGR